MSSANPVAPGCVGFLVISHCRGRHANFVRSRAFSSSADEVDGVGVPLSWVLFKVPDILGL